MVVFGNCKNMEEELEETESKYRKLIGFKNDKKDEKEEDKDKKYVVRESSSSFYRRIQLPERADADKIQAHLEEGVLKVSVPLTPLPEPKKIAITAKAGKQ